MCVQVVRFAAGSCCTREVALQGLKLLAETTGEEQRNHRERGDGGEPIDHLQAVTEGQGSSIQTVRLSWEHRPLECTGGVAVGGLFAPLVLLDGFVTINWHHAGLYPRQDGLSLKNPHFLPEVVVSLQAHTEPNNTTSHKCFLHKSHCKQKF